MSRKVLLLFTVTLLLLCCLIPSWSFASIGDPGCDPFDPLCPIDGGLSCLIAAGIGIGAKKAYNERKKQLDKTAEK